MPLQIIGIYSDIGASKRGSVKGVDVLMELLEKNHLLVQKEIKIINDQTPTQTSKSHANPTSPAQNHAKNIQEIYDFFANNLVPKMTDVFQTGKFPLIFSADHSNALGTIQALKRAYPKKSIAIIWVDAHSDIHTPYDSPSGNIHGMPLGALINVTKSGENLLDKVTQKKWEELCLLGGEKTIDPRNIIYIGTRSMEKSEREIINKFQIPLYEVVQIRNNMHKCIDEIIAYLSGVDVVYLSVDVDVLDGKIFTSTGVRENNGLYVHELNECIKLLIDGLFQKLIAVEFTEFNPTLKDSDEKDSEVLFEIITNTINQLTRLFP